MYPGRVRFCLLLCISFGCGRYAFDDINQRDRADAPAGAPEFVRHFAVNCDLARSCTIAIPGTASNHLLIVTATYNPPTLAATAVEDDLGQPFHRVIDPIAWAPGIGDYNSEIWWGRSQAATAVTLTLSGAPRGLLAIYVNEFAATSVDQSAAAAGFAASAGTVSSGTRDLASVPQLIFCHGEGQGPRVLPALGFTPQADDNSNIEATKPVSTPGAYDARFQLDSPGAWVALMVTLQ